MKLYTIDTDTREILNRYLFADIRDDDITDDPKALIQRLEPFLIDLKIGLDLDPSSRRGGRRRSLKRVMLSLTTDVIGDTRIRLNRAFDYFGYVDECVEDLKDHRWWVRAVACKNAGLMLSEKALPHLEVCLDDENGDVRIEAVQAMIDIAGVEILGPVLMRLKDMSPWMQVRVSRSILSFGEYSVPHLITGMRSKYPRIQAFCAENLGILGDIKAVPTLLEYIDYSVTEVKHKSLIALGRIGDPHSVPVVVKYLRSGEEQLRVDAAKAAGNLSSPSMAYDLYWLLVTDTVSVKLAAAEALSRSGELGIRSLHYALNNADDQVRMIAMQFLHEAGHPAEPAQEAGR
ncbi:MAG: HEAT repeat domain-containing protein [Bacteroidota bacterium]